MKDSLLIFGGGPLQLSIIGVAKDMGFNAIVVDPDPNAPGKEIANKLYAVAGNDFDKTLHIAQKYNIKGINPRLIKTTLYDGVNSASRPNANITAFRITT